MKAAILVATLLCSSVSFAQERIFDCVAKSLTKKAKLLEDARLSIDPTVVLRQLPGGWTLDVGHIALSTFGSSGPALNIRAENNGNRVNYMAWVDGSLEFELSVSVIDHSAKLFWWGPGDAALIGKFQCEVIEQ